MSHSNVQGRIVHAALEEWAKFLSSAATSRFPVRDVMHRELAALVRTETLSNPRFDFELIRVRLSLDNCVNAFKTIASLRVAPECARVTPSASHSNSRETRSDGPEVRIEVAEPGLCGRLDAVYQDRILEFKTGEPARSHADQIRFYALLWWMKFGVRPVALTLVYGDPLGMQEVAVPLESDLRQQRDELAAEVGSIRAILADGSPEARPDATTCKHCPVRQHCDAFWTSPATAELRAPWANAETLAQSDSSYWADVMLDELPQDWEPGRVCAGRAVASGIGTLWVSLDAMRCPKRGDRRPNRARLLGARLTRTRDTWRLVTGPRTEIFWFTSEVPSSEA